MNANEITTHRNKTREEIDAQAERLMQANETWYSDAIRAGREPKNRKAQIIAAWHNTKQAAKEDRTPAQPTAKRITVKRSEWSETAKRLECSGWYYIGTPTATGKTIYRRGNSEIEIIIEDEQPAPEFSELSHAAQCLDIYLHNTREIYERYTVPAIKEAARRMRLYGVNIPANVAIDYTITGDAMDAARALVVKYDHLHPTASDCTAAFVGYDDYIMESATFEVENA